MNISETIRRGNITREFPGQYDVPALYLGSGDFGGCFDETGLMNIPYQGRAHSNSVFMHADYYHRGKYGLHYHLPVMQIKLSSPEKPKSGWQTLDLWDGRLTTESVYDGGRISLCAGFSPERRDVFALMIDYEATGELPCIRLCGLPEISVDYGTFLSGSLELNIVGSTPDVYSANQTDSETDTHMAECSANQTDSEADTHTAECSAPPTDSRATVYSAEYTASAGNARAVVSLRVAAHTKDASGAGVSFLPDGVTLTLGGNPGRGQIRLYIGVSSLGRAAEMNRQLDESLADGFFDFAAASWHRRWGDNIVTVDDDDMTRLFVRSVYYILCSFSPSANCIAPPTGWTSNAWAFHFPQDFSYIAPVLLKLGHADIMRAKLDYYRRQLDTMREYTRRIYHADGTMWAWEFPIGDDSHILPDGAPNHFQFEIHNAAYVSRMAWETALCLGDDDWAKTTALPIIFETAKFYLSILNREDDGSYGITLVPSMGQDEFGGEDAKNYLCALYAAEYSLKTALAAAERYGADFDGAAKAREILASGIAFGRLYNPEFGAYQTYECPPDEFRFGRMKHPVPLMPLTFLPKSVDELNAAELIAYRRRYDLCERAHEHFFSGWTLFDYLLAEARMGDVDAFRKDFAEIRVSDNADPELTAIYETCRGHACAYYITSHGLLAQAVIEVAKLIK